VVWININARVLHYSPEWSMSSLGEQLLKWVLQYTHPLILDKFVPRTFLKKVLMSINIHVQFKHSTHDKNQVAHITSSSHVARSHQLFWDHSIKFEFAYLHYFQALHYVQSKAPGWDIPKIRTPRLKAKGWLFWEWPHLRALSGVKTVAI
jgi:hypothetical protein